MAVIPGLEWTFNTVAEEYDRWAPEYPAELYRDLFRYCPLNETSSALEIGIGTGQATLPVLETGCRLTAVELGDQLAEIAGRKFSRFPGFHVYQQAFQDFSAPEASYDLIYSAGAFHWSPEQFGYSSVFRLLKSGGLFARFAKHTDHREEDYSLYHDMQKIYALYMPYSKPSPQYTATDAEKRADIAKKYGFCDCAFSLYSRFRSYTAREYTSLIATYSDHVVLPPEDREGFYGGIERAIEKHGGTIILHDILDLEVAKKP